MAGDVLTLILVCCYAISSGFCGGGNEWSYKGQKGPSHWPETYKACGGKKQSPINVDTSLVQYDPALTAFNLTQLNKTANVNMRLENVGGHTVEVHLTGDKIEVSGAGLNGSYEVAQFHFHWGGIDETGSEHTFNGKHFPMEMHIVMFSTKFPNISTAMTKQQGLSVLGFFFEVGKKNAQFDHLLQHFSHIEFNGEEYNISTTFPIMSLLPGGLTSFYRYDGSLTTPPCLETVVWTLFTQKIQVSEEQLEKFRHVKSNTKGDPDEFLFDDFRPTQPLNHRVVTTGDKNAIFNNANRKSVSGLVVTVCFLWIVSAMHT